MHSYRVSTFTATSAASGDSQPELAIEHHQQGSFVGLFPTTVHTPESTYIPADDQQFSGLRLLAEVSTSQIDPFDALATHRTVTFDKEDQEQSASSLLLPDEPQVTDDAVPTMVVAKPHETGISEDPKRPSGQNLADQNAVSTDKWIMYSGDKTRRFKCGYEDCGKTYTTKHDLRRHFLSHIGDSQFRCYSGDCAGTIRYCDKQALARHIHLKHTTERPFECDICNKRFTYLHNLTTHRRKVHSVKDEQKQPQNSDSTDKWIIYSGDKTRLFKCGYEGCGKIYTTKQALRRHLISHIGDSQFRCCYEDCAGALRYYDSQALAWHIRRKHSIEKPFKCNICNKRFMRPDYLKRHKNEFHSTEKEQTTKKVQESPPKRKRN